MNICVFCSAANVDEKYTRAAKEFAALIGKNGHTLVWGGSNTGLMHEIAVSAQENGAKLVGISMELFRHKAFATADEMIVEETLALRKATMLKRTDAFVTLVGGIGTLDEISEILALKTHGTHDKPVVLLDTDHFYEGLRNQLQKMSDDGFLHKPLEELVFFADTPEEAMEYINTGGKNAA